MAPIAAPEISADQVRRRGLRPGLGERVLIGFVLGIAAGIFFGETAHALGVVGVAFVMLLQVAVIPYIVVSLITALGRLTLQDAKRLALKTGGVVLVLWGIGIVVVLLTPLAFPDWPSASFFSTSLVEQAKPIDFLKLYIPANPFASLANAVVPAIVVFSVLIGVALIGVKNKRELLGPLSAVAAALTAVTGFVARLGPYGVFALAASAAGTLDLEELDRLQVYVVVHMTMAIIVSFWVLPALVTVVTPLRYGDVMRVLRGVLITAFAAGSVVFLLPLVAMESKKLMGAGEGPAFGGEGDEARSTVDVLVPTAYNIPSVGSMLSLVFVLFAGWYIGSPVPVSQFPLVIGAGLASLSGGPVIAIPFLLDLLKLPHDLFQIFITMDFLGRRLGTMVTVMTIATTALIGAYALQGRARLRLLPLFRFAGITAALLVGSLIGIRAFYTFVVVAPYTKDQALRGLQLLANPQPATVHHDIPPDLESAATGPADITQIQARGVLRACYLKDDFPSSFFNADGQLVGFGIELAHRLARSLELPIEFVPVEGEGKRDAARLLDAGVCDLYASPMAISARRVEVFTMTIPVYTSSAGFIVPDHQRHAFQSWDAIRQRGASVRIAVPGNPEAIAIVRSLLPEASLVPLDSLGDQRKLLASEFPGIDAIADLSEAGAAWTLLYPRFNLVVPKPVVFTPLGVAVARGNQSLAQTLDAWIIAEKAKGTLDALYRYWMLGEAARSGKPPRWSVIRNVLHWVR
jgi:Na+/H+-dicarboxylate symporter/ABC-type amino acid transport substrate-binding protein